MYGFSIVPYSTYLFWLSHVLYVTKSPVSLFVIMYFAVLFSISFPVSSSCFFIFTLALNSLSIMNFRFCGSLESWVTFITNGRAVLYSFGTFVSIIMYSPYASSGLLKYPCSFVCCSGMYSPSGVFA